MLIEEIISKLKELDDLIFEETETSSRYAINSKQEIPRAYFDGKTFGLATARMYLGESIKKIESIVVKEQDFFIQQHALDWVNNYGVTKEQNDALLSLMCKDIEINPNHQVDLSQMIRLMNRMGLSFIRERWVAFTPPNPDRPTYSVQICFGSITSEEYTGPTPESALCKAILSVGRKIY